MQIAYASTYQAVQAQLSLDLNISSNWNRSASNSKFTSDTLQLYTTSLHMLQNIAIIHIPTHASPTDTGFGAAGLGGGGGDWGACNKRMKKKNGKKR